MGGSERCEQSIGGGECGRLFAWLGATMGETGVVEIRRVLREGVYGMGFGLGSRVDRGFGGEAGGGPWAYLGWLLA